MSDIFKTPGRITIQSGQLQDHPFAACELADRDATIARLQKQLAGAEKVCTCASDLLCYRKGWLDDGTWQRLEDAVTALDAARKENK